MGCRLNEDVLTSPRGKLLSSESWRHMAHTLEEAAQVGSNDDVGLPLRDHDRIVQLKRQVRVYAIQCNDQRLLGNTGARE